MSLTEVLCGRRVSKTGSLPVKLCLVCLQQFTVHIYCSHVVMAPAKLWCSCIGSAEDRNRYDHEDIWNTQASKPLKAAEHTYNNYLRQLRLPDRKMPSSRATRFSSDLIPNFSYTAVCTYQIGFSVLSNIVQMVFLLYHLVKNNPCRFFHFVKEANYVLWRLGDSFSYVWGFLWT